MARHRRALILLSAAFVACGSPKPPPPPALQPIVVVDAGPPPIEDAGAPAPPPIPRLDCALKPGDISADESPTFKGVARSERLFDWLAARGVANADTIKWYAERVTRTHDAASADVAIGEAPCFGFTIGKEEAIVCEMSNAGHGVTLVTALGVVIRQKKPVVVLDTGLALGVSDEHRIPDLQIAFAPDMRSFELRDRSSSPDHIVRLVEPPSKCAERQQVLDECAARLASGKGDTSLCSVVIDASGQQRLAPPKVPTYELSGDCSAGPHEIEPLYALASQPGAAPTLLADAKRATDFVKRSCAARGTWKWNGSRYAK